jgi:uncharacterized protein (DUF2126 family)/transglutaminase-like putative cysteine protease
VRLLIQHHSTYTYPRPAALGPQVIRLRPASHAKATIETYSLRIEQDCMIHWHQDPSGNRLARVAFREGQLVDSFDIRVELAVDIRPVNPFDFFVDDRADKVPFRYPEETQRDLLPFLATDADAVKGGPLLEDFLASLPTEGRTVPFIVEVNRLVNERIRYVIREETGIWTPEETLANGRGSCRDSAVLLIAALRSRGLAARFVSGYLVQLKDEGMIPNQPKGVGQDVADLHAWAEVYLPGAGWIGLDATSGLLCGEGHIPLACTAHPPCAAPIEGTSSVGASSVGFSMAVGRLGHEPRPTEPYEEEVWQTLLTAGDALDARLAAQDLTLTMGGEPTFNARDHAELPEWNEEALGPSKWAMGLHLASELKDRLAAGGVLLHRQGKLYPGESIPRWALEIIGRRDGEPLVGPTIAPGLAAPALADARALTGAIARRLGLEGFVQPAFEDPWRFFQEEASLPIDVDPLKADLTDPEERRRLARALSHGLAREVGYVLPLTREAGSWVSERWIFRRGQLFLIQGDSPIGLRLPLRSLPDAAPPKMDEEAYAPPDPRLLPDDDDEAEREGEDEAERQARLASVRAERAAQAPSPAALPATVRTALAVEARQGSLFVFLPPLPRAADFIDLVALIGQAAREVSRPFLLEGYPPRPSPDLMRFAVTPDPGVLEVNIPPASGSRAYAGLLETVFDAALHAGLHSEKYLLDGRMAGSGGGNHLTLGGPTPLASPFLRRPDLLASLVTFIQHHPSLSYMFTGLFVGPTSQAPRVDEARHDALYELEIALDHAFAARDEAPPPWLSDILFRHLLVDVSGNTHRAEICLDKLFSPDGPHGRQGLVELRAFEMPPHPRMAVAQMLLVRALITAFAEAPYRGPLVRFGPTLHDRYLLPFYLWRDFEDVLTFLASRGLPLPAEAYRPFVDLRCPKVGEITAGDIHLEVRNAIEPWHVLGEEMTAGGTSRYVDSSMERVEVRVSGFLPERYQVLVNGQHLPLRPTATAHEQVGGVRFRAWAPPHSLHAHIGVHHPLRFDVLDRWAKRSIGAGSYHVWHPEGRGFKSPPLTRFEASARRAQRFTAEGQAPWPIEPIPAAPHPDAPYTLDLRRYAVDHPLPKHSNPQGPIE